MINSLVKTVIILAFFNVLYGGTDGTIRGQVTDIDGGPLPGAQIYIPDLGCGAP